MVIRRNSGSNDCPSDTNLLFLLAGLAMFHSLAGSQSIRQDGNRQPILCPICSPLAGEDPVQTQYFQSVTSHGNVHAVLHFSLEAVDTMHCEDNVEQFQAFAYEHWRVELRRSDIGGAHFLQGFPDAWITQILKPEVHILCHDRRSLQGCGG